ncbi:MBL fold metallo-hydrolase [Halodesulfurarchaeum sp.]|uniref:MBL fold metallo-hydrolase n=1 Tax=Halodesulfurarchaeum sp. TaxID=1980530 RepID=UPI002FC2D4E4
MNQSDSSAPVPESDSEAGTLSPANLRDRIERRDTVTILDVRISGDYETWHIEDEAVETTNVPYYAFLEDEDAAIERVPAGDPIVVVCAEGDASKYVAGLVVDTGRNAISLEDGMEGWAGIYDATEITSYDGPGTVIQYHRPSTGCLSYLVASEGEAAVIDPLRAFTDRYLDDATELGADLEYAIDTHCHADHVSGVGSLTEQDVWGLVPAATIERGMEMKAAFSPIEDGETVDVGAVTIEARHTPGHTSGMTSYLVDDQVLLTGDSLFVGSVARPDLEAGDEGAGKAATQLYESLQERILSLDEDVIVAGGHRAERETPGEDNTYTARLGTLVEEMAVLSMDQADFVEYILSNMPPRPANYETIIDANLGHREIDDEEAFRIELGPNNCAASQGATIG